MVIAQYRHPNYDLYKRSIIGEIERREDEPAVYRALEEGINLVDTAASYGGGYTE